MAASLVAQGALYARPLPALASNVFCGADASYVPWDAARRAPLPPSAQAERAIRVQLYAQNATTASALVTFITDSAAYQATVAGVRMHAPARGGDDESDPVLVTFPQEVGVRFAYVDSYSVNGAALSACPSFVNQVVAYGATPRPRTALPSLHAFAGTPTMPVSYASVGATMLMALPSLSCGAPYIPATMGLASNGDWSVQDEIPSYGTGRAGTTAVVAIAITSDGKAAQVALVRSSGNQVTDTEAVDQARTKSYGPAQFLCTPVVSLMFMTFQQK